MSDGEPKGQDLLPQINALFQKLLETYAGGISNKSTAKYADIKALLASALSLPADQVYVTGSGSGRMSNLDTRFPQGNQRNQNAALGVAFVKMESREDEKRVDALDRLRKSFSSTCDKFVSGQERGTTFDGILGFVQFDDEIDVTPLRFIHTPACSYAGKVEALLPGVDSISVARVPGVSVVAATETAGAGQAAGPQVPADMASLLSECELAMSRSRMYVGNGLVARYLAALMAKRFVILSGLSGSGKTKLAILVGKWLEEVEGQVEVVAVGSDWTSNENVLGYRDALDPSQYRKPTSGALELILKASKDQNRPYFLILDEMNLSHVERYFSDLLSAIESGQPVALHSSDVDVDGVPPRITLPPNLFIVGTVNVDETTYTFSPKVLDRANVIEFRVSDAEMTAFLQNPSTLDLTKSEGKGVGFGQVLVDSAALQDVSLGSLPNGKEVKDEAEKHLSELFALLSRVGAEFGYRVALEVYRFIYFHARLVGNDWNFLEALDAQIVQKLMPKLHGSDRKLRPVLVDLERVATEIDLPLTLNKARRMLERLKDGFTSYLES